MLTKSITLIAFSLCTVPLLFWVACTHRSGPARPGNVSVDAVFVAGTKVGWWQECTPTRAGEAVHCRIWNGTGLLLEDEDFLPCDKGSTVGPNELTISPDPVFPGPDRVFLTNGRIPLPSSRFEELTIFVDWLKGKRDTPR